MEGKEKGRGKRLILEGEGKRRKLRRIKGSSGKYQVRMEGEERKGKEIDRDTGRKSEEKKKKMEIERDVSGRAVEGKEIDRERGKGMRWMGEGFCKYILIYCCSVDDYYKIHQIYWIR